MIGAKKTSASQQAERYQYRDFHYRENDRKNQEENRFFFILPNWVAKNSSLSAEAKLIFSVLNTDTKTKQFSVLTNRQIACDSGMTIRAVSLGISELKKANLIHSKGLGKARKLFVNPPQVEKDSFIKIEKQNGERRKSSELITEATIQTLANCKLKSCTASSATLAGMTGLSRSTITRAIARLKKSNRIAVKTTFSPLKMKIRSIFVTKTNHVEFAPSNHVKFEPQTMSNLRHKRKKEYKFEMNIARSAKNIPTSEIFDFYMETARKLKEKNVLKYIPVVKEDTTSLIKERVNNYGVEVVKKAIKTACDDGFVMNNGFNFSTILSTNVFNRLINGIPQKMKKEWVIKSDEMTPEKIAEYKKRLTIIGGVS